MFSPTKLRLTAAAVIALATALFAPVFSFASEISFDETLAERVVATNSGFAVVGDNSLKINISVPRTGPTNYTGATLLQFSIGNFQFSESLGNASNYTHGASTFTFVKKATNHLGAVVELGRINVAWTRSLLTISGTVRDGFVVANNYLNTTGAFNQVVLANISFDSVDIVNRPIYISGKVTVLQKRVGSGASAQDFDLDFIEAVGSADFTPPTVAVTSLVANARLVSTNVPGSTNFTAFTTNIFGTASDNVDIAQVLYRLAPSSQFLVASGTTNWVGSNITPVPGTNTLLVKSIDSNGNVSKVQSLKFFYSQLSRLTLTNSGAGFSSGVANGQLLEIGRGYSVTAKPVIGNLFSHWSGSVTSQAPTLKFLMRSNMLLQANFVPNPFPAARGTYSGLFSTTLGVELNSAGLITLKPTGSGFFTGTLWMKGSRYPFDGQFHPTGTAQTTVRRPSQPSLKLNLLLDLAGGVSGKVKEGNKWTAEFSGKRGATASFPGRFTLLIPRSEISNMAPQGFGFATMTRSANGNLFVRGTLADGTIFSQSTFVSPTGTWPLFASLYRGKGLLLCAMQFPTNPNNDIYGEPITWLKTTNAPNKFYTNGFALAGPVVGSTYVHSQGIGWTVGTLERGEGDLTVPRTNQVAVGNNSFTIVSQDNATLSLNPSGLLSGGFTHPNTGRRTLLRGVFLQKSQFGGGFFLGPTESGSFMLQANP